MAKVIIGVDPHKLSATIEVVDRHEKLLGSAWTTTSANQSANCPQNRPLGDQSPIRSCDCLGAVASSRRKDAVATPTCRI